MSFSQWNSWHAPPPLQIGSGGGGEVNNFRKVFAEWWAGGGGGEGWVVWNFNIGRGHVVLKLKLKLHNTSIKSIFGIANLIYISDIWKMHLFWKNFFNGDMWQVFGTLCCFFQQTFFEATCISCFHQYPSSEIPRYEFFFSHPSWELKHFFGRF